MDTFAWILIGSIGFFFVCLITLGLILNYKLSNRKNVHGIIFTKTGSQKKIKFDRQKDTSKSLGDDTYIFDERAIVKTNYKDFIYFMQGNPKPIIFDFKSNKPEIVAQQLKEILDSDLVQKLFSLDEMKLLKLLIIINIVIGVLTMLLVIYTMFQGTNIKQSTENYNYLYNITRNAIMGV